MNLEKQVKGFYSLVASYTGGPTAVLTKDFLLLCVKGYGVGARVPTVSKGILNRWGLRCEDYQMTCTQLNPDLEKGVVYWFTFELEGEEYETYLTIKANGFWHGGYDGTDF